MSERITIADAARHVDETVEIPGWLYNLRKSGKIVFPILRDGTGLMQCVAVKSALPEEVFEELKQAVSPDLIFTHRRDDAHQTILLVAGLCRCVGDTGDILR